MTNIISINNMSFSYKDNEIFNNFNLNIKEGDWVSLIGPNGCGKSTLIKLIVGLLEAKGSIIVNSLVLNNETKKEIRKQIGIVFENPDNQFVSETVLSEIVFKLENLGKTKKEINIQLEYITSLFNLKDILKSSPHELTNSQKQLVSLAAALIDEPKILILDEALNKVDKKTKALIFKTIKNLDLTVINITHDTEDTIFSDKIIVMDKGKIELYDEKKKVLQDEKTFNKLGLELPFLAALSIKLKYYDLVDDLIFDMEKMVDKLWK